MLADVPNLCKANAIAARNGSAPSIPRGGRCWESVAMCFIRAQASRLRVSLFIVYSSLCVSLD